ncbi:MAG: EamA family transporter [Clostridia bacterium]|nr:EamA family transporter [Clostridia bacterium]
MKQFITNPRVRIVLAMVVFGTIALFVAHIPLPSTEIALYRAVLASLLIGGVITFRRTRKSADGKTSVGSGMHPRRDLPLLLLSGIAMGGNWILLFEAYKYTTVSAATLSYYFAPVLVTLVCPILFREHFGLRQGICFVGSTVGVVLLTGVGAVSGSDLRGIALGLGAACLYAAVILINKAIRSVSGIDRTLLQFLAAVVTLIPYVALTGGFHLLTLDAVGWGYLLCVGLVHTGITYCLYFSALRDLPGQEAAILSYIDPLTAVLLSVFVLGEAIAPAQIIGGVLILGASIANEIKSSRPNRSGENNQ